MEKAAVHQAATVIAGVAVALVEAEVAAVIFCLLSSAELSDQPSLAAVRHPHQAIGVVRRAAAATGADLEAAAISAVVAEEATGRYEASF